MISKLDVKQKQKLFLQKLVGISRWLQHSIIPSAEALPSICEAPRHCTERMPIQQAKLPHWDTPGETEKHMGKCDHLHVHSNTLPENF